MKNLTSVSRDALFNTAAKCHSISMAFSDYSNPEMLFDAAMVVQSVSDLEYIEEIDSFNTVWDVYGDMSLDDLQDELKGQYRAAMRAFELGLKSSSLLSQSDLEQLKGEGIEFSDGNNDCPAIFCCSSNLAVSDVEQDLVDLFVYIANKAMSGSNLHAKVLALLKQLNPVQHTEYVKDVTPSDFIQQDALYQVKLPYGKCALFLTLEDAEQYVALYRQRVGLVVETAL